MSPALSAAARLFYETYVDNLHDFEEAAKIAGEFVSNTLADAGINTHAVEARAKDPHSLLRKLRSKVYVNPPGEITDVVGVRVITYYRDEVDPSASVLRDRIDVDEGNSVDKRAYLGLREFGYRSVHLIARLKDVGPDLPDAVLGASFEIQIRSILEHAWAEIEHEIVYKSGIKFDADTTLRPFAAVAGALELMDGHFEELRSTGLTAVNDSVVRLAGDVGSWAMEMDAASLIATFESLAPNNPGWRARDEIPSHSSALVLEGVRTAGLTTPHAIRLAFESPAFNECVATYAAAIGVALDEVSHLAMGALLVGSQQNFPRGDFPDLFDDPLLVAALEG